MIEIVTAIVASHKIVQAQLPSILTQLKNTSHPLEERWAAYTILVQNHILVKEESYGDGYTSILGPNVTMYDDFNTERHSSITFPDMYERIVEDDDFGGDGFDIVNVPVWQEAVLASGYSGFTYDW